MASSSSSRPPLGNEEAQSPAVGVTSRLSQSTFTGADQILKDFANFLLTAQFGKTEKGMEKCTDDDLHFPADLLFKKLWSNNHLSPETPSYNVLRIRGPTKVPLVSSSCSLIPINVWGENASVETLHAPEVLEMPPGSLTYFEGDIHIMLEDNSVLDVLFVRWLSGQGVYPDGRLWKARRDDRGFVLEYYLEEGLEK
jgi:hypothetical protein